MKQLLFFFLTLVTFTVFAQTKKSTYKVEREAGSSGSQDARLIVKFVSPNKQLVKSSVKLLFNNEEEIFPDINEKGVYKTNIDAGVHSLKFMVPYWYDAVIDKLKCNKNEIITITIYFNAKEI